LVIFSYFIITNPQVASANFFTNLFGGNEVQANESNNLDNLSISNSQTIALLESQSSINPDVVDLNNSDDPMMLQEDSFIYYDRLFEPGVIFEKSSQSDKIIVYTVKQGDTLSEIAELFNISTNTIRWENNISGNNISVGKKLNILPVTGIKHIVKSGDTISKIASKYEADANDILIFNGIDKNDSITKGDIIFVPNGIIKPAVSTSSKTSSSSGKTTVSNTKAPAGYYIRPVPGRITSPYGPRKGGFHYGVDLGGINGVTPVVAAADGVVSKVLTGCVSGRSSCGGRYGNYVVIEHPNGTSTMYAHLYSVSVSVGQSVSQGEKIGVLGNTGRSTGPHLHFEVRNANGSTMRPPIY